MAQLVEQRIRNAQVVGSSPTTSSKTVFSAEKTVFILSIHFYIHRLSNSNQKRGIFYGFFHMDAATSTA